MNVFPLSEIEQAETGATHCVRLTYADLTQTGSGTAQTIPLFAVANKVAVKVVRTKLVTVFQDSDDAAFNSTALEIGDGNDADRFLVSQELNVNGTELFVKSGVEPMYQYTTDDTVDATITPTAAKVLDNIDAGEVLVFLRITDAR